MQPLKKRASRAKFICWTVFWRKCWRWLFFLSFGIVLMFKSSIKSFRDFLRLIETRFFFTTTSSHWFWKATRWVILTEPPPVACLQGHRNCRPKSLWRLLYLGILVGVVRLNPLLHFLCNFSVTSFNFTHIVLANTMTNFIQNGNDLSGAN